MLDYQEGAKIGEAISPKLAMISGATLIWRT